MTKDFHFMARRRIGYVLMISLIASFAFQAGGVHAQDALVIPPVPMIVVPDIIGVEPVQQSFEDALGDQLAQIDGVHIAPARCDASGAFEPGAGMILRDDAGVVASLKDGGNYLIDQGGAGVATVGGVQVIVEEDGSGVINRESADDADAVQITVEADGSGSYNGPLGQITLDGNGGGTWNSERSGQISIEPDGSGTWNGPLGQITNEGDGSGTWNGDHMIINNGDGSGLIDGKDAQMDPLPPVPPAGKFPLLTKFRIPPAACGYVITLEDRILFDFDKSDLRKDAAAAVDALSAAFVEVSPKRLEIRGHTDSKGSVEYNQDLSERRARTISLALEERGVDSLVEMRGFGESQPVAANEVNGNDNPAGRQRNRRVEIYVPNG